MNLNETSLKLPESRRKTVKSIDTPKLDITTYAALKYQIKGLTQIKW